MSFEKPERFDAEASHEEANMLRAKLGVSAESGKIEGPDQREDRELTAEDYDKALAAVEELRHLAESEPDSLKVLNRVSNVAQAILRIPGLGVAFLTRASHALMGTEPGGPKERWDRTRVLTDLMMEFDDAESQLRTLRSKGERFGEDEARGSAA